MIPLFAGCLLSFLALFWVWYEFVLPFLKDYHMSLIGYLNIGAYLVAMINFVRCQFSDPGIIPRSHPNFQKDAELSNKIEDSSIHILDTHESTSEELLFCKDQEELPKELENKIKSEHPEERFSHSINEAQASQAAVIPSIMTERFCNTCNILRPPKTSHCKICDNCILNFDQ